MNSNTLNLLLSYLNAAGKDIAQGHPMQFNNVNDVTKNLIASKSYQQQQQQYLSMLSRLLGGGGKLSMDGKGINLSIPHSTTGVDLSPPQNMTPINSQTTSPQPTPSNDTNLWIKSLLGEAPSPFSEGQLGNASLAGLDPNMLASAFGNALDTSKLEEGVRNDRLKNALAVMKATAPPPPPPPPKDTRTSLIKDFEYANQHPGLLKYQKELAQAGAPKIENVIQKSKELAKLQGQKYFENPSWVDDVNKYLNTNEVQNQLIQYIDNPNEYNKLKATFSADYIKNKIVSGGGKIQNVRYDKASHELVWTVKWPSGDVTEVRHGI